jgi:small subunit ribosomal protein S17
MSEERDSQRKTKRGVVVSNKMDKTVVVRVDSMYRHPIYGKTLKRSTKVYAHDDSDALEVGDEVIIMETRPLSKLKRWSVVEKATPVGKGT